MKKISMRERHQIEEGEGLGPITSKRCLKMSNAATKGPSRKEGSDGHGSKNLG